MTPGETFLVEMPGGGGYGDPRERPAESVLEDVLNGYVSAEAAERDYGVAVANGRIDEAKTARLRAK
jgi:N-methylhydantoinase B